MRCVLGQTESDGDSDVQALGLLLGVRQPVQPEEPVAQGVSPLSQGVQEIHSHSLLVT